TSQPPGFAVSMDETMLNSTLSSPASSVCNGHFNSTGCPSTRLPSFNSSVSRTFWLVPAGLVFSPANKRFAAAGKMQNSATKVIALTLFMKTFLFNHTLYQPQSVLKIHLPGGGKATHCIVIRYSLKFTNWTGTGKSFAPTAAITVCSSSRLLPG